MTERSRGYFNNSIKSWRDKLNREHRALAARLETLRGMKHPCAADQEELMRMNREILAIVERYGADGEAAIRSDEK